jgi:hypothetical protein
VCHNTPIIAIYVSHRLNPSPLNQPQPGEIWELSGDLTKIVETHQLADPLAVRRYISIVREPPACSGLDRDILAETWNVGNLARRVGKRLCRSIYDLLLSIGGVFN